MAALLTQLSAFAGIIVLGQISPGPDLVLLTQTSLRHGRSAGWWATAGIGTGLMAHAAFAVTGLDWIAKRHPSLWLGLRSVAGLYLLWLALSLWKHRHPVKAGGAGEPAIPAAGFYRMGLFCNLLNPKVPLFFGAVVTPFLGENLPGWWPWALWGVIVGEGFLLWGLWVACLEQPVVRRIYARAAVSINILFAAFMALLAVRLLWEAVGGLTGGYSGG